MRLQLTVGSLGLSTTEATDDAAEPSTRSRRGYNSLTEATSAGEMVPASSSFEPRKSTAIPRAQILTTSSFVQRNRVRGMQSDGVPDQLDPMLVPAVGSATLQLPLYPVAGGDSPVHLEAFVGRGELACAIPAEIVQNGAEGMGLQVYLGDGAALVKLLVDDGAEDPRSHHVVECHITRRRLKATLGGSHYRVSTTVTPAITFVGSCGQPYCIVLE